MAGNKPRRGPRVLRDQPPLDAGQVVSAAVRLTREHGLAPWTMRQLADELECWSAVIYHHVGDRDTVTRAVVDHVVNEVSSVGKSARWREWFHAVMCELRAVLRLHPGVAGWLATHGPVVPAMLRILDRGVELLSDEGLGIEAPVAYSVLIDAALLHVAMEDQRDAESFVCDDIAQALTWYRGSTEHRGLALAAVGFLEHWSADEYFFYSIERALDSVAIRIAENRDGRAAM